MPGRLAVVAGTVFSAISGSTIATTAMLGSLMLAIMLSRGYHPTIAAGPIMAIGAVGLKRRVTRGLPNPGQMMVAMMFDPLLEAPMTRHDPQYQYVEGQDRPTFAALLAEYEALSASAIAAQPCSLDLPYGSAERQRFDFFPAQGQPRATLIYLHAGYWQARDKATFRFIAPAFTQRQLNVALVNYPLCPAVTLTALVEAVRACVPAVLAQVAASDQPAQALMAAGHSAGAHLAVELAMSCWPELGVRAQAIDGVLALSGIYDLAPLLDTSLNIKLGLDADSARALSPLHRVRPGAAPALFVVGGDETPAFFAQNQRIHQAWQAAGNSSASQVVVGADHFSLLRALIAPESSSSVGIAQLLLQAQQRFSR